MDRAAVFLLLAGLLIGNNIMTDAAEPDAPTAPRAPTPAPQASTPMEGPNDNLPVLQPSQSVPVTGTYTQISSAGKLCLKVTMGVEYIVMVKKKPFYFNLEPKSTEVSGYCNPDEAVLSLAFAGNNGGLTFTFKKEGNVSFVKTVNAHLKPVPCKDCAPKAYPGVIDNEKLFLASSGRSFKCNSKSVFVLAEELHLKIQPLQVQAFNIPADGKFGDVVECWADYIKRLIPIIVGAIVVGLCLIAVMTFLIIRDRRRRQGYDRI